MDLILDVGCGRNKVRDSIGIDRNLSSNADVIADLDTFPYPFIDNTFSHVYVIHVIEHLSDVIAAMTEFHRLLKPGGLLTIVTPHYTDFSSFCDPSHRAHLTSFSFRYFGPNNGGFDYYTNVRFRELQVKVTLLRFWRLLGLEYLVNITRQLRLFWEYYCCYVIRGKIIEFQFMAIK